MDGSDGVRTGAHDALIRCRTVNSCPVPSPSCWSRDTNTVIFSRTSGDAQNLWEIGLSPQTGKVAGTQAIDGGRRK